MNGGGWADKRCISMGNQASQILGKIDWCGSFIQPHLLLLFDDYINYICSLQLSLHFFQGIPDWHLASIRVAWWLGRRRLVTNIGQWCWRMWRVTGLDLWGPCFLFGGCWGNQLSIPTIGSMGSNSNNARGQPINTQRQMNIGSVPWCVSGTGRTSCIAMIWPWTSMSFRWEDCDGHDSSLFTISWSS